MLFVSSMHLIFFLFYVSGRARSTGLRTVFDFLSDALICLSTNFLFLVARAWVF